jgi:hypothetical protein
MDTDASIRNKLMPPIRGVGTASGTAESRGRKNKYLKRGGGVHFLRSTDFKLLGKIKVNSINNCDFHLKIVTLITDVIKPGYVSATNY